MFRWSFAAGWSGLRTDEATLFDLPRTDHQFPTQSPRVFLSRSTIELVRDLKCSGMEPGGDILAGNACDGPREVEAESSAKEIVAAELRWTGANVSAIASESDAGRDCTVN